MEFVGLGDELVDQLGGYALSLAFGADAYGHDLCVISVVPEAGVCVYGSLVVHVHIVAAVWRAELFIYECVAPRPFAEQL